MYELNNIKNKMSIDESLYNYDSIIEFINNNKILIYIKNIKPLP